MVGFMPNRELGNEATDRIEDRVQRIAIASEDHPGGKRSRALLAEGIEALVYDHPRVGFAGACAFDGIGDAPIHRIRDRLGELALQPGRRAEMMQEIGVGPADLCGDRLERHRLRPLLNQQLARCGERGRAAFFRGEAGSSY